MKGICPERGEEICRHEEAKKEARKIDLKNASKGDSRKSGKRRRTCRGNI